MPADVSTAPEAVLNPLEVQPDAQLLARLRVQLQARRAELDAEMARAREDAAVTVAAAHRAARVIVSRAKPAVPVTLPEPHPEPVVVPTIVLATEAPVVEAAAPGPESFDREDMATLLAALLDERMSRWAPVEQPRKPSFWSHVFHVDVIIVTLVGLFCLAVVAAWMS